MRNKIKPWKCILPTLPFFLDLTLLSIFSTSSPRAAQGDREWGCSQFITHCLCHCFLLTLFPCSNVGSLPWETVLHKLLQHDTFPRAAVLQKSLQHASFPQDVFFQEQTAQVWVHHGVTNTARKPVQAYPRVGCPQGASSFRNIHLLWHGVLHGLQVYVCSIINLHGLQRMNLSHHGLHHGLQESVCSGTWSTSSHSFFTDLGVCRVVSLT